MAKEKPVFVPIGAMLPTTDKAKQEAIDKAVDALKKKYSDEALVQSLGSKVGKLMPSISSGIPELDYFVLGPGGWPKGRVIELFGPESGGKTTIALTALAEAQKVGGKVAFVDAEHALDPNWAKTLGVNVDDLLVSQPDYGEQGLDVAITLIETGAISALVVDSVAALVPLAELTGDMDAVHVGLAARMMSKGMRKLAGAASKTDTIVFFINQIREKIGVMFGNPETTPGGRALKHAASLRIDIRRTGPAYQAKGEAAPTGHNIKAKAVKNKVSAPFREANFDLFYTDEFTGFDKEGSLVKLAAGMGIVDQAGAYFSYKNERLGQGKDKAGIMLRNAPQLTEAIRADVLSYLEEQRRAQFAAAGK